MRFKKDGFPQESELVLVKVRKILPTSVFVDFEHYKDVEAVLHISEIAPGRIRNLKEYVSEGKMLITQVLRAHHKRKHIDVSLRRVSEGRRIKMLTEMKQEQKAEKLLDNAAQELKISEDELYSTVADIILKKYRYIHEYFINCISGDSKFSEMKLPKEQLTVVQRLVKERVKPPLMEISGAFVVKTHASDGVSLIADLMKKLTKVDKTLSIKYGGAGNYPFTILTTSFELAEEVLKKATDIAETFQKKNDLEFSFTRSEGKKVEV